MKMRRISDPAKEVEVGFRDMKGVQCYNVSGGKVDGCVSEFTIDGQVYYSISDCEEDRSERDVLFLRTLDVSANIHT